MQLLPNRVDAISSGETLLLLSLNTQPDLPRKSGSAILHYLHTLTIVCLLGSVTVSYAQDAVSLKARYNDLQQELLHNQFQRPIYMESSEVSGKLQGDVYALVEQPYALVGPALQSKAHWCDILILHLNVKACRTAGFTTDDSLLLNIGRKFDQPLKDTQAVVFTYRLKQNTPDYLQVELYADEGPLGTSDYQIKLKVVALENERSFLHFSYSYQAGLLARMSMQSYLATIGRDKNGFSIVGYQANGQPVFQGGMQGVIERNTMRYYLAIEAYLGALSVPESRQLEKRLQDWHAGVERYPLQLHELERDEYMGMKHKEVKRQQALNLTTEDR